MLTFLKTFGAIKFLSLLFLSVVFFSSSVSIANAQLNSNGPSVGITPSAPPTTTPAPTITPTTTAAPVTGVGASAPATPAPDDTCGTLDYIKQTKIDGGKDCQLGLGSLISIATDVLLAPVGYMAYVLFQLISGITVLAGTLLNFVIDYTVVNMAQNIQDSAVTKAWGTIRDVANMGFIFVLLYAAIQKILGAGKDTNRLIVNMIVVAILINFSLFATKIVIDSSNVIAVTFYDAIAPGATSKGHSVLTSGLSNSLMEPLRLNSIMKDVGKLEGKKILMISIMGSIFSLIAAFIFLAISLMLIIRFVVLIFVMILSPIAFIAYIFPGMGSQKSQWQDALIGQAFFAPVYFMLTWVVILVMRGLFPVNSTQSLGKGLSSIFANANTGNIAADADSIKVVMNFIIIIVFLIASLLISKKMSDKAGPAVSGLTKSALGFAGASSMGLAGRAGRRTLGAAGQRIAESRTLKNMKEEGGAGGFAARLAMATGRKTATSSFDMRGTGMGKTLGAGAAQKGGYSADLKERDKNKVEEAKRDAPTEAEKQKAQKMRTALESTGVTKAENNLEAKRRLLKEKEEALENNRSTMTPEQVAQAENEIATLRTEIGVAENEVDSTLQNLDPNLKREFKEEKSRQTAASEKLEKEAAGAKSKANDSNSRLSDQERYDLNEDAANKMKRAEQKRASVVSYSAYVDSVLGVDPKEVDARKAKVETEKQAALKAERENGDNNLKTDPIIVEADEQAKLVKQAKDDLKKAEEAPTALIIENAEKQKAEIAAKKEYLATVEAELAEKNRAAEIRTQELKDQTAANINNLEKEHEDRKSQIKEVKNVADRRKESIAQGEESGWVAGKVGRKIEGVAGRMSDDSRFGRTAGYILRQTGSTIRHSGVSAAAELRKGKKPTKELLEDILKAEGEISKKEDAVKSAVEDSKPPTT